MKQTTTHSICPECKQILTARLEERDGALYLEVNCPIHGVHRSLYKRDASFYRDVTKLLKRNSAPDKPIDMTSLRNIVDLRDAKIIGIDLTNACNLQCPMCFASSNQNDDSVLSNREILESLRSLPNRSLEITLLGGEPTLREDLPELIHEIVRLGFKLKLITNGLRFEDNQYAAELKRAGLQWIIYQFDGFERDIYQQLRGMDLLDRKMRILETLTQCDFQICLAVMVVKGINDHCLGELIEFGFSQPNVRHIALLPVSSLGRDRLGANETHLPAEDVMDMIAEQTGGRIVRRDWLDTMKWMNRVYRLTRHIDYKQRVCFFSMPLLGDPVRYHPLVHLARPAKLDNALQSVSSLAYVLKNMFSIDSHAMPKNLLYLSIEKMHCTAGIHLEDASQCNTLYLTRDGFIPTCIYNAVYREARPVCEFS